jgi:hypothetical protein
VSGPRRTVMFVDRPYGSYLMFTGFFVLAENLANVAWSRKQSVAGGMLFGVRVHVIRRTCSPAQLRDNTKVCIRKGVFSVLDRWVKMEELARCEFLAHVREDQAFSSRSVGSCCLLLCFIVQNLPLIPTLIFD